MMGSRLLPFAFVMLVAAASLADVSGVDKENARTYMADGRAKRDSGDLKGALQAFQAADALMHVPTTTLEVARTEAMLARLIEAHEDALKAARSPVQPGETAPLAEARIAAQKLADDVEPRIPSIRLVVKNASTDRLTVLVDDVTLPPVAIGLPRRLDPGTHVIVAKLGSTERRLNVQVVEREEKEVTLDFEAAQTTGTIALTTTPVTTAQNTGSADMGPTAANHAGPWVAVGITTLAVGAVGLVIGGITGATSLSQTSNIKSQCSNGGCPQTLSGGADTQTGINNARTMALVSDIGFIAGGVLAAAGIIFVIVGSSKKSSHVMAIRVGPASLGLEGSF